MKSRIERRFKNSSLTKKILKLAGNLIFSLVLVLMIVLLLFVVQSRLADTMPIIAGHQIYVVLSGSMSPTFNTGSIVVVSMTEASSIEKGDIITYIDPEDSNVIVTHRVRGINTEPSLSFTTRGDANDADDLYKVPAENLIGRVRYFVPYVGYVVSFSQTREGVLSLILVPSLIIIISELRKLIAYATEMDKKKKGGLILNENGEGGESKV